MILKKLELDHHHLGCSRICKTVVGYANLILFICSEATDQTIYLCIAWLNVLLFSNVIVHGICRRIARVSDAEYSAVSVQGRMLWIFFINFFVSRLDAVERLCACFYCFERFAAHSRWSLRHFKILVRLNHSFHTGFTKLLEKISRQSFQ